MSRVMHDYLAAEITEGEFAAIESAGADGWINPPVYNCLRPEAPRRWRSVHLRYLERRGLIGKHRRRIDGAACVRLNAEGMELRLRRAQTREALRTIPLLAHGQAMLDEAAA